METARLGELAALATAGCWTITALSFESAGRRVGSLPVNFIRLILAFLFLMIFGWLTRGRFLPTDASLHAWGWLGLSGLVGFALGDLCLFRAFLLVGARISMLLMSLVPPITALIGLLFLGEQLTSVDWIGMALTVGGVTWVVRERPRESDQPGRRRRAGILLGLGAALGQAVGLILSKYGMGSYDPFAANQIRILAGVLGFAGLFVAIRWWPRVWAAIHHREAMARITLGALFGPFLGVSLSLVAVQKTHAGIASTIMSIVPVLIIIPTVFILKQPVSLRAVLGAMVAVAGVALLFIT